MLSNAIRRDATAGKQYELAPTTESFQSLLEEGKMSLVREKVKLK